MYTNCNKVCAKTVCLCARLFEYSSPRELKNVTLSLPKQ